jgi:hypothetical protein
MNDAASTDVSLRQLLEVVIKIAAAAAAICYVLGFLVISAYLSRFGYFSLDLLKAQYFVAGAWAMVPVTIAWVGVAYLAAIEVFKSKLETWVLGIPVVIAILAFGYLAVRAPKWLDNTPTVVRAAFIVLASYVASSTVWAAVRDIVKTRWDLSRLRINFFFACMIATYSIAYLATFARFLYGDIPSELGGGRARIVQIVVDSNEAPSLAPLGFRFKGCCQADSILLLLSTSNEDVFLIGPEHRSVSLRSSVVRATVFASSR